MAKYGKWVGGALGWAFGGPIGAALGFFMGTMFDDNSLSAEERQTRVNDDRDPYDRNRHNTRSGDFAASMLVLSAAVMKADGKVLKSELNFVKDYFVRSFGEEAAEQHILMLRELLKQDLNTRQICEQVRYYMEHSNRLLLMQYLFGIAMADGDLDKDEIWTLRTMAHYMGISNRDFESLLAMFNGGGRSRGPGAPKVSLSDAYTILEIEASVDDAAVKSAYRRMAKKYHPDKNRGVGEEHQKMAEAKFIKVNEAYEAIKDARGMT